MCIILADVLLCLFCFFVCLIIYYRGFGFVTFGDPHCVDKVLANSHHDVDGKKVRRNPCIIFFTLPIVIGDLLK